MTTQDSPTLYDPTIASFAPYAREEIIKLVDIHRCLHTGDEQGQPAHGGR
jgi:hypothetical protein